MPLCSFYRHLALVLPILHFFSQKLFKLFYILIKSTTKIIIINIQKQITEKRANDEDVSFLLKKKIELLSVAYEKFFEKSNNKKVIKNPKFYALSLSYLNNIKDIQTELKESTAETDKEIEKIYSMMKKDGLGWLLEKH